MSLEPLLSASPVIQIHAYSAVLALVIGGVVLFQPKGDAPHRRGGRVWVGLMVVVAISSLFIWQIRQFGLFSWIHALSLFTLGALWLGIRFARQRRIAQHRRTMQATYVGALVITGLFTFTPGRIMYRVLFGEDGASLLELGAALGVLVALFAVTLVLVRRSATRNRRPA